MNFCRSIIGFVLAWVAMPALAISLGQVQMQSGLGQPLLATIPIYDASSLELQTLEIRLAPNDAFVRLGLDRRQYDGIVIDIVEDENGLSVIQLSSKESFNEPVLNLLLETKVANGVGQVKEFTALVDPPFIARAAIQTIESPTVPLTPVVAEPVQSSVIRAPLVDSGPEPEVEGNRAETPLARNPALRPSALETQSGAQTSIKPIAQAPTPIAVPQIPATATNQRDVIRGESLYRIALEHKKQLGDPAISLSQMMTAIQRANSQAFIRGDRNLLKRGSVLRMPDAQQVRALLPEDSANLLNSQWARAVQAQPAPVRDAANRLASPSATESNAASAQSVNPVAANRGRLRIVPTVGAMNNAGSQSGASESGTGSELRAEAGVAQEDLAASQLEISNLRNQLDEASKLQAESKRLIELQSTQIKQLTQRMQDIEKTSDKGGDFAQSTQADGSPAAVWYSSPFVLLGVLLTIAVLLGLALKRRR